MWVYGFNSHGIDGLRDLEKSGRPPAARPPPKDIQDRAKTRKDGNVVAQKDAGDCKIHNPRFLRGHVCKPMRFDEISRMVHDMIFGPVRA